ncbi:hypothetical protein CSB37_03205 [bacterium DOLZORAL124_38_8]|nr:MAG: hypothetical protein CSB37_03205 [bacterium DOLZORAL124_38_8]
MKLQQILPFGAVGERAVRISEIRWEKYKETIPNILEKITPPSELNLCDDTRKQVESILQTTGLLELKNIEKFFPNKLEHIPNFAEKLPNKEFYVSVAKFNKIKIHFDEFRYKTKKLIEMFYDLEQYVENISNEKEKQMAEKLLKPAVKIIKKSIIEEKAFIENSIISPGYSIKKITNFKEITDEFEKHTKKYQ